MPMWCSASDLTKSHAHHRIVRIPPGEAVVLNSAERAPYLLLIEILDGDLDFDPAKRANRDLLTKIVLQAEATVDKPGGSSLGRAPSFRRSAGKQQSTGVDALHRLADLTVSPIEENGTNSTAPAIGALIPPTPRISMDEMDEEMDLVEQIYGTDLKSQAGDLSDSVVLPALPKNKTLEMRTWSASNSPNAPSASSSTRPSPAGASPDYHTSARFPSISQDITLDDYSERMRAAASMLAQLNASLVREPVTTIVPPGSSPSEAPVTTRDSGALSWLPGKGWILTAVAVSLPSSLSPSKPTSDDAPTPSTPVATRMKLQPSEVAEITERIMQEMLALEEERMQRMKERVEGESGVLVRETPGGKTQEDENIVRRELNKADPSGAWIEARIQACQPDASFVAAVFRESWPAKKSRIRAVSPYGHLANWDVSRTCLNGNASQKLRFSASACQ